MSRHPDLITPAEAAVLAACSVKTVRRAYRSAELASYRRPGGRAVRLRREEVLAWSVAESAATPSSGPTGPLVPETPARNTTASRAPNTRGASKQVRAPKLGSSRPLDLRAAVAARRTA